MASENVRDFYRRTLPERTCVQCLKPFQPSMPKSRLCSVACQAAYSAEVFNAPPRRNRTSRIAERHRVWRAARAKD